MPSDDLRTFLEEDRKGDPSGRVVRLLRERGSLSAAEIARASGLAKSTVSSVLAELRRSEIVVDAVAKTTSRSSRAGRPGTAVTLNPRAGACVGVAIGPTDIRVIAADVSHAIIADQSVEMPLDYSPQTAAKVTRRLIEEACAKSGVSRAALIGAGIAVPGPVHPETGRVQRASMVPTWAGTDIRRVFAPELDLPIFADNESNCSAIAEMLWGAAVGCDNFIFFKVDLGIGGAIVVDRRVITGLAGGAGEFGHMTLDPAGELCICGNRGCLELYGSLRPALRLAAARFGASITIEELIERANAGDVGCRRLIEDAADVAGRGLAMVGTAFNPPLIVVGGRATAAGDLLFEPLLRSFDRHTLIKRSEMPEHLRTRIVAGTFTADDSCLGAVGLVLKHHGRVGEARV
jgi:predicted NBD/HSP70 family sugar kinase/DNA-binding transcriptional ArsR family regulator